MVNFFFLSDWEGFDKNATVLYEGARHCEFWGS